MIEHRITLPPEWVETEPDGTRTFQAMVRDISDVPHEALILHAPTGAGKTHALRLWLDKHVGHIRGHSSMLVVTPTNALAAEVQDALSNHLDGRGVALRWTAHDLKNRQGQSWRPHQMEGEAKSATVIVTNPDNLHRFTNHAYGLKQDGRFNKMRPAVHAFETCGLVVIDEYHSYDEQLLASLLLLLMQLRNRETPPKFLFMSATPDGALPVVLKRLGIDFICHEVSASPEGNGGPIKHEIQVTITNEPLLEAIRGLDQSKRTLVVADRFLDVLAARRSLPGDHVATITGPDTSRKKHGVLVGQERFDDKAILLATSKVDVGLNIPDIQRFHLHPGFRLQQSWQRFGRAGRDGPAEVFLHLERVGDETLAGFHNKDGEGREELGKILSVFLRREELNVNRIQQWMATFLAFYHTQTPKQQAHRAVGLDDVSKDYPSACHAYGLTFRILTDSLDGRPSPGAWNEKRWQQEIRQALVRLRGDQIQVEVQYPEMHGEGETCMDDLTRVLAWMRYRKEAWGSDGGDRRTVFVTEGEQNSRQDLQLTYPLLGHGNWPITTRYSLPDKDDWNRWSKQVIASGRTGFQDFNEALGEWLRLAGPGAVRPLEACNDDQFI